MSWEWCRGVSAPLRDVLTPHVLSLYGSSNKRWPIVTSAACSPRLRSASSRSIKAWGGKKTVCQTSRRSRTEPVEERSWFFYHFLWIKTLNLWQEEEDIRAVQDQGWWVWCFVSEAFRGFLLLVPQNDVVPPWYEYIWYYSLVTLSV